MQIAKVAIQTSDYCTDVIIQVDNNMSFSICASDGVHYL